jgi:co-chaperonin GroES (HSP10)
MDLTKEKDLNELLDLSLAYQPFRDDVVLNLPTDKEMEALNKTSSGIVMSNNTKKAPESYIHTVLAVGPDVKFTKVGDKVLLRVVNGGHSIITIDKKAYVQVSEFTIYGKMKNENKENKSEAGDLLL